MPITVALSQILPNPIDVTQNEFIVDGTLTLTGSYPTNGDTLSFAGLGIPSNQLATFVEIFEVTPAPGPAYGGRFHYLPGTTQNNGLMEIFNGTTQITTQTYANFLSGITGFALRFRAWFPKYV